MHPFEQSLDIEPAFPQGFPARGTAAAPSQVASTAGDGIPTLLCGQGGGRYLGQQRHDLHQVGRQDLAGQPLRRLPRHRSQLQQAHGRGRQQSQQATQGLITLQLAQLDAAAGFEALMIVLDDPARTIPVHALPRLRQCRGRHRGQQDPFQGLHTLGRFGFPHPYHPHHQRTSLARLLVLRRQQAQAAKAEHHVRHARFGRLARLQVQVLLTHRRPATHHVKQMLRLGYGWLASPRLMVRPWRQRGIGLLQKPLHAAILRRAHHKVALLLSTEPQEREHVTVAIPYVDPLHPVGRRADGLHTALPHLRLARALLPLPLGFALGSWLTQKRLLMHQPQYLATLRYHSQHALQQIAVMGAVADGSQPRGRGVLLVVHFRRILDQQHLLLLARLRSRLRHMRPDQLLIGHIRRLQEAIGRLQRCLIRHLCGQGGCWMLGDGASNGDGSLRATRVTQVHAAKGVFSPLQGRQHGARIHHRCSFSRTLLHPSWRNSTTSRRETCDKQSGGRPGRLPYTNVLLPNLIRMSLLPNLPV